MPKKSAKPKVAYVCEACGAEFPKWSGQCTQCGAWNSLSETISSSSKSNNSSGAALMYGTSEDIIVSAADVLTKHSKTAQRLPTGMYELDRVFGGGIVFGSVILLGGEPGIGKSTILTQMLIKILSEHDKLKALYVAGEESPQQISQRIQRMAGKSAKQESDWQSRLTFFSSSNVDQLVAYIKKEKPDILVVDSVQTLVTEDLSGMPGSVGQLREVTSRLVSVAKQFNIPTFLVGHVTKDGDIAGPKVLEHIVDSVLQISGARNEEVRLLRSLKNRFGPTDEVGLFRLTSDGVEEVHNPAEIFLEEQTIGKPGSALALCMEGSRPVVVEVQALAVHSFLPSPRRVAKGVKISKLHLLLAVLQKHAKLDLSQDDVYVNVVGSLEFSDPAIDLAIAAALLSTKSGKSPGKSTVYCGEIGLLGEIRSVVSLDRRLKEAKRLGYPDVVSTQSIKNVSQLT